MNKTLYVKDEDGPIWDKARELTGDKLSQFVMEKLRAFVSEHEGKQQGFQRIAVHYIENGIPRAKAFMGRWLIPPERAWKAPCEEPAFDASDEYYAVAITAKDNVVVFEFGSPPRDGQFGGGIFSVHDSFEQAHKGRPWGLIVDAMRRMGVDVQELDI